MFSQLAACCCVGYRTWCLNSDQIEDTDSLCRAFLVGLRGGSEMVARNQYRRRALECMVIASGMGAPEHRAFMLQLADFWLQLADYAAAGEKNTSKDASKENPLG
jgi:hypothetical protein